MRNPRDAAQACISVGPGDLGCGSGVYVVGGFVRERAGGWEWKKGSVGKEGGTGEGRGRERLVGGGAYVRICVSGVLSRLYGHGAGNRDFHHWYKEKGDRNGSGR